MQNDEKSAIMKITKIPEGNIFCHNNYYESEIIQKLSENKGFP